MGPLRPHHFIHMHPWRKGSKVSRICPWCDKRIKAIRLHLCFAVDMEIRGPWPWWISGVYPFQMQVRHGYAAGICTENG